MDRIMPRSLPPTAVDAVTLLASGSGLAHGRQLALREQNTMHALGLVRAGMAALQGVSRTLERAGVVLARSRGMLEPKGIPELRQLIAELAQQTRSAQHDGHTLLNGGSVAFALADPWLETSELTHVELPALSLVVLSEQGLAGLELTATTSVLAVLQRMARARTALQEGHALLQRGANQLNVVLQRLHADRNQGVPARVKELDIAKWVEQLREHMLAPGSNALSVQGTPTTRAASLVEGAHEQL
jgi:hypothetical protein